MVFLLTLSMTDQVPGAIDMALDFAKEKKARLKVLFVLDSSIPGAIFERLTDVGFIGDKPSKELQEAVESEYRKQAVQQLEEIKTTAAAKDVDCETMLEQGDFVEKTLAAAAKCAADVLIVSRTRQSALSRMLVSSAVDKLIKQAPCKIKVFEG